MNANEIMLHYVLCHLPTYASADGLLEPECLAVSINV